LVCGQNPGRWNYSEIILRFKHFQSNRYIVGAADHTICYYHQIGLKSNLTRYIKTTSAHQLALAVIFYSPLQFLYWYDKPSDVQNEPELEFFDQVPVAWDDTKVVQGFSSY
jgi:alpha-glucosidase